MEEKQVYYNDIVYNIDKSNIKSINKTDVAKINDNLVVYWDKKLKKWKEASEELTDKFFNTENGKFKLLNSNEIYNVKIKKDDILTFNGGTYTNITIKKFTKLNKDNIWEELSDNSEEYEIYNLINNKNE